MHDINTFYKLDENNEVQIMSPEEVERFDWKSRWHMKSKAGVVTVSTIFLVINHRWFAGKAPLLFETCLFHDATNESLMVQRYETAKEAEKGHDYWCATVRSRLGILLEEPVNNLDFMRESVQ